MLVHYKKACRKLAMGLLALMPQEKDLRQLQKTITLYENDPAYKLYLWKADQKIIGVIGVIIKDQNEPQLQHLSVLPSFRNQGVAKKMINGLQNLYPHAVLTTNEHTSSFCRDAQFTFPPIQCDNKTFKPHLH